jgi:hypothetical protein
MSSPENTLDASARGSLGRLACPLGLVYVVVCDGVGTCSVTELDPIERRFCCWRPA